MGSTFLRSSTLGVTPNVRVGGFYVLLTMLKACLAALRYLAGVKIASEAGLGSLGNDTFSLGWRWSQELLIASSKYMVLKLKL